ncbi:phage recombination protein Bet [Clostridium sp. Cult2]|uniref:phage recombination protein Bet n=1 Tax=Clostridium sp. Cult2 TaxID=2079003 RepID=UPI001EFFA921|nr:phage recombination protein Bet [Clostridium sp. Cult2]MCF6466380.1 phage recombination protein Bet [Clostridium sp. Cult2]
MANIMKYETDNGEITLSKDIVKRYLVSGDPSRVTDQEVVMFMQMCKYQNLNPFLREAYLIKFGSSPATMVTGKDTFVKRAAKSKLCTGYEAGVIVQKDKGVEYRKGALVLPNESLVGGWAKVYRKDWQVPLENTVSLEEYQRYNSKGELMNNWAKMPATMIRKVALVQALREAIPEEFSGLYSPEEMPVDDSKLDETPIEASIVDEDLATKEQLNRMYDLAEKKNMNGEEIKKYMRQAFGKELSTELTKEEANKVIEMLENIKEKEDEEEEIVAEFDDIDDIADDPNLPWNQGSDEDESF